MSESGPRGPNLDTGIVRLLAAAGAVGGPLWAAIPLVAAVTFYGVEAGLSGLGSLRLLGSLFLLAPVAVVCLLAGAVGLWWRFRVSSLRLGRVGSGALPDWLAIGFAAAMPVGFIVGAAGAVAGGGNLALVLGLMVPYGLAWAVLGGHLAWNDQ